MTSLILLQTNAPTPTSALPADWAVWIIVGLATFILILIGLGVKAFKNFDNKHTDAMQRFDLMLACQAEQLTHIKEIKYSQQEGEKKIIQIEQKLEHMESEVEKNTKGLSKMNSSINALSKKVKCQEIV